MNENDWTVGNTIGHIGTLMGTILYGKAINDTMTHKEVSI